MKEHHAQTPILAPEPRRLPLHHRHPDALGRSRPARAYQKRRDGRVVRGRARAPQRSLELHRGGKGIRWLIAAVELNYLAEAHHPHDVTIASGIGRIGEKSWTILSGAFQRGLCVATCDTTLVYTDANGPYAYPAEFRAKFEAMRAAN